ncbi:MAG TPA: FAD/NAD(P)-binding oxidoreductase [Solirubrobacteraceae bacterium]|nr:FAD/NAD(P)-binding oxidoreductase [Solirubrobacteraceae bacterium]
MTVGDHPVVVIGAGPAGLACAIELRRRRVSDILVLERESQAGGIPRHSAHQGFGVRDLRRVMSGPRYARRYVEAARRAGARLREEAMVTGWSADGALEVTSPEGREALVPAAVVLATGCRERPRAARLVPGSRPQGVMTTGTLQQLVELHGQRIEGRVLVVGAEHVSFSALLTLSRAGARVIAMVTELPRHQSLGVVRLGARLRYRTPLWTRTALTGIYGRHRVEEVEVLDLDSAATRRVPCNAVVFTADWIPDHELAVLTGLDLDPATRGPRVDTGLRTNRAGVFAAGNLLQGAEPADVAALSGRHAAASVAGWLTEPSAWPGPRVPISCHPPLQWISPNAISPGSDAPPRGCFALRSTVFLRAPLVEVRQDGRTLWRRRLPRLGPGRSTGLSAAWERAVDPSAGAVEVGLAEAAQT